MITVGLTGSIGMGKSTTAAMFAEAGAMVYDADAEVAAIYAKDGAAVEPLEAAFPGVVRDGIVDREALRQRVLGDPEALKKLNSVVHPLLGAGRTNFFQQAADSGADVIVLDIPLLFETGGEARVDAVVVVSAPAPMQRARVTARPGWNDARLDAILTQQTPDAEKRARADFVIDTGAGLDAAREQVRRGDGDAPIGRLVAKVAGAATRRLKRRAKRPTDEAWRARSFWTPRPPDLTIGPATG